MEISKAVTIIGAGAGSGKTHRLCDEYYNALTEERIAPEHVLATTFTRKAAKELVRRLRARLITKGENEKALCVEDGYIGTVHSVCLSLLADFALDRGLSPDLATLPEEEENHIFRTAAAHVLERFAPHLNRLAGSLGMDSSQPDPPPGLAKWDATVREICKLARANGIPAENLAGQAEENVADFMRILPGKAMSAEEKRRFLDDVNKAVAKLLSGPVAEKAGVILKRWQGTDAHTWKDWVDLANIGDKKTKKYDEIRLLASRFPELPEFRKDMADYIRGLFACAADALDAYADYKKDYGLLDYNDMESMALELLKDPKLTEILSGRIERVFVDEFQDTSPLQLALFLRLAAIAGHSVWVGDTKQAIYGFRGTDPVLMQTAVKAIGHDAKNDLKESRRSRECLVNFTNAFFTEAFTALYEKDSNRKYEKDSVPLGIPKELQGQDWEPTGLRYWEAKEAKEVKEAKEAKEAKDKAEGIARRISELLEDRGNAWSVRRRGESGTVPARPGDIAVLCRKNKTCSMVAAALREYGISADVSLSWTAYVRTQPRSIQF